MTGIIFSNIQKENFSFFGFYLDRVRRIMPALTFLCLSMLIVGWFLLLPSEYQRLGTHIASSLAFISNIMFWKESGYFEQASQDKWLLHTWSLSIEWQFYVFYPLFILYLKKILPIEKIRWIILTAALISFMLSIFASSRWPTSAFYLLPTRAWELLTRALVYLFPIQSSNRTGNILKLSGLALIAFSALYFSEETTWPGLFTTIPVLGAALVIAAPSSQSWLLGNKVSNLSVTRPTRFIYGIGLSSSGFTILVWRTIPHGLQRLSSHRSCWVISPILLSSVLPGHRPTPAQPDFCRSWPAQHPSSLCSWGPSSFIRTDLLIV